MKNNDQLIGLNYKFYKGAGVEKRVGVENF